MKLAEQRRTLRCAIEAARKAGAIMARNLCLAKTINAATQHDIKLELDERCQQRIESMLRKQFPHISILGEEGTLGDPQAEQRWVVDPIDGTVNFTYGIPHACVSIALQERSPSSKAQRPKAGSYTARVSSAEGEYRSLVGVVHDPFTDELFTGIRGQAAHLNGRPIRVSSRRGLAEAIVSVGFAKTADSLNQMLPAFQQLVHRVRKIRIMGAAALSLAYVAAGRMDAYIEFGLRLWDIAAGGLIIECAGGDFFREPLPGKAHAYRIVANNGLLRRPLERLLWLKK